MIRLKRRVFYKRFGMAAAALVGGVSIVNLILPDKTYSATEKRNLQTLPELSIQQLADGSFMEEFDDYETDQFVGRNVWMSIKTTVERLFGKNESQGVLLCDDGYLMEAFLEPDEELMEKTIQAVNDFKERYAQLDMYFFLVPNDVSVLSDLLPAFAQTGDQNLYIDSFFEGLDDEITLLDVRELFEEKKEELQLYYKTDHHWTTDAAYEAYLYAADVMDLVVEEYQSGIVTTSFNGALTSKSGFLATSLDSISVYLPVNTTNYVVTYVEEQRRTVTFYVTDCLSGDDPYQIFFGGNYPQIIIDTDADSDRTLLVLKDSFANCFIPFLASSYKQIVVVDPRYYYDDLNLLMQQYQFTDVLFLYNASTLSEDNNLYAVLNN